MIFSSHNQHNKNMKNDLGNEVEEGEVSSSLTNFGGCFLSRK